MKKHAIIPIFIPHEGCPNDCVFCNQKIITARAKPVTAGDIKEIIENHLETLLGRGIETIEVAFFGGSFTGIEIEKQSEYLEVAYEYKRAGKVDKIHLSTRPDYIDKEILDNLKRYSVDVIELGVQSFDEEVLNASKRGHTIDDVYRACDLIKAYGFTLGIQLMIGLPKDTKEKSVESARKVADIGPQLARLYPTVVLEDTELANMFRTGEYPGLKEERAVETCADMYKILYDAGINIMRVGLKSTDLVTNSSDLGGNYHPAFRQLVEGKIARDAVEDILKDISDAKNDAKKERNIIIGANPKSFSNLIGHKGVNKKYFENKYSELNLKFISDEGVPVGKYIQVVV